MSVEKKVLLIKKGQKGLAPLEKPIPTPPLVAVEPSTPVYPIILLAASQSFTASCICFKRSISSAFRLLAAGVSLNLFLFAVTTSVISHSIVFEIHN